MKPNTNETVNIKVVHGPFCPMVFVGIDGYDNEFYQRVKLSIFNNAFGPNAGSRLDWNAAVPGLQEFLVIARWLDKGFVCYPTFNHCGAKFMNCIRRSLMDVDPAAYDRFVNLFNSDALRAKIEVLRDRLEKSGEPQENTIQIVDGAVKTQEEAASAAAGKKPSEEEVKWAFKKVQAACCCIQKGPSMMGFGGCNRYQRWFTAWGLNSALDTLRKALDSAKEEDKPDQPDAAETPAPQEGLKEIVGRLGRKDIVWSNGDVYLQTGYYCPRPSLPMAMFWARYSNWGGFVIEDLVIDPLSNGKVLLTLPDEIKKVQDKYWSILTNIIGEDDVRAAKAALDIFNKALDNAWKPKPEQPASAETPTHQERLKEAVEKLGRKDVILEQEGAYLLLRRHESVLPNTDAIVQFLGYVADWDNSQILHRFTGPLKEGKILLTLPEKAKGAERVYRDFLGTILRYYIVEDIKTIQDELHKIMAEQSAPKVERP